MKELRVAKSAGFCFGVRRSVDMAEKILAEHGNCCSFGELIHNEDEIQRLKAMGLRVIHSSEEAKVGEHVIVRAHGITKALYRRLEESGAAVSDATCPKVKAIHTIVSRASEEGRFVIIIGMRKHPEVEAICGWCNEREVFENASELSAWLEERPGEQFYRYLLKATSLVSMNYLEYN